MGTSPNAETDAWLLAGGLVVTASDRARRALIAAFHRARRAEGLSAWPAPHVEDWRSFALHAWSERCLDGRLLLNATQERTIWAEIAQRGSHLATVLEGPRHRIANLAMEAHDLLCTYAPRYLRTASRSGWQQDAAVFSTWLAAFDEACRDGNLISPSRVPLELIPLLEAVPGDHPPLLLVGFDRITPAQRSLFNAWGEWREAASAEPATDVAYFEAADSAAELAACALWCRGRLEQNPQARLMVITQDAAQRRGEIERAFLRHTGSTAPLFEFSLGVPLSSVPLARGAHTVLRWLAGSLNENELDWLISTGQTAADPQETAALQRFMRELRRSGRERLDWTLEAFTRQRLSKTQLPASWVQRMNDALKIFTQLAGRPQSPLELAEAVPRILETAGWPGHRPLASVEYQAARRWQQVVEGCGSLGFDGRRIRWQDFLAELSRAMEDTLFAPESQGAPILIAGPAESAGLTADAAWFLSADEIAWPATGSTHPFLPVAVQREALMPHATAQLDADLARAITARIVASDGEVRFSYAKQNQKSEAGPSRLVEQLAGKARPLPAELRAPRQREPLAIEFNDDTRIPFPPGAVVGGSSVLTYQSQCPFKAFAVIRLGASSWEPAVAGLTPIQRGNLLHAAMHALWAGAPDGIRSSDELHNHADLNAFIAGHVARAMRREITLDMRESMPRRYLQLEELRLTALLREWLEYEKARRPFAVIGTERDGPVEIGGLAFNLRLDRVDRLSDESLLVIDYKTGKVSLKSWELPRPDDVQLPLYAAFALDERDHIGGLAFAKVLRGEMVFEGRLRDADGTLLEGLKSSHSLMKNPLYDSHISDWRARIEQLSADFVAGRAEVDPREYPKTCEHCGLQAACRVTENRAALDEEAGADGEESAGE